MEDSVTLDRGTFKALASETRVAILKSLDSRRKTASELAHENGATVQSVSEHLDSLSSARLVEREDNGRKWIYYSLTGKGRAVLHPEAKKFWVLLAVSLLAIGFGVAGPLGQVFSLQLGASSAPTFAAPQDTYKTQTSPQATGETRAMAALPPAMAVPAAQDGAYEDLNTPPSPPQDNSIEPAANQGTQDVVGKSLAPQSMPFDAPLLNAGLPETSGNAATASHNISMNELEMALVVIGALLLSYAGWIKTVRKTA